MKLPTLFFVVYWILTVPLHNCNSHFVIPSMHVMECQDTHPSFWLSAVSGVGNQRFETVLVAPHQLLRWDSELHAFHEKTRPTVIGLPLNIIVEFSDVKELRCGYNWTQFEAAVDNLHQLNAESNPEIAKVKSLVFPIGESGEIMNADFASRMSKKLTVGCTIWLQENWTNVTEVLNACKSINGSLYLLKIQLQFDPLVSKPDSKNAVLQRLETFRTYRDALLSHQKECMVYFYVDFEAGREFFQENYNYLCSESAVLVGSVTDTIVDWAKFQSFPVVLNPFFAPQGFEIVDFSRVWIMFLRRLSYPVDVNVDELTNKDVHESNTPIARKQFGNGNVSSEMCINMNIVVMEAIRGFSSNFFHNENIGAVFYSEDSGLSNVKRVDEYATMLQFIFYKFHMVEITIGHNFELLLNAMDLALKLQPDIKTVIYLKFTPIENDVSDLSLLLDAVRKSQIFQNTDLLKGIHIDVPAIHYKPAVSSETMPGVPLAKSVLRTLEIAQSSELPIGIFLNSTVNCRNVIYSFLVGKTPDDIGWNLLSKANYIVCTENINTYDATDRYGVDAHLFISRLLRKFLPHLRVLFRLDNTRFFVNMEKYDKRVIMQALLVSLSIFKYFGSSHNISYFIMNAFQRVYPNENGWWEIKNYSDLANPNAYAEREAEYLGRSMWYPTPISKLVSNSTLSPIHPNSPTLSVILSYVGLVALLLFAGLGFIVYIRYRKTTQILSDADVIFFQNGRTPSANGDAMGMEMETIGNADYMKFKPEHSLNLSDFTRETQNILGSGSFGTVFRGVVKGLIYIATELCSNGSLQSFLRKKNKVVLSEQTKENLSMETYLYYHDLSMFATQISNGMEYIASKHVVHGDLATRSVLLDKHLTCKIGDFGLSRKLYEYQKYVKTSQEPLPWKWMANEALVKMEFTSKSDVWSFGVTLWEIYSLGKIPFSGLNWTPGFADELQSGLRLTAPEFASEEIFSNMQQCWNLDPDQRPTFVDLSLFFRGMSDSQYTTL